MDVNCDITADEEEEGRKKKNPALPENPKNTRLLPFDSHFIDLISHP